MSGHSKWNNIKHKKAKTDAARANVFTKIAKEISIAVKESGGDPATNSRLRDLITKARASNVPNDNIERTIKKALGSDGANYEEITYEGYGPEGVAVIVETSTDNRNRTAGEVRHAFDKFGGNLGATGCVSYMFSPKGVIIISSEDVDEDALMEAALEAGASDFEADPESEAFEIYTEPDDLYPIRDELEKLGYKIESAEKDKIPQNYVSMTNEENIRHMNLLLDTLEDNEDVLNVFHNWENCDDE
ncbi:MAG: YebC/PmpR family DNA-binding transcriptional regulator [Clostridia bacterium]|nr:YebC/PmpR family DNA-binding transcriptional regulator [Clostridia bacterium]MDY3784534.1 YebC/PmpR family DNA-binding transcriptional regulator [Eubacteriales bacterium]